MKKVIAILLWAIAGGAITVIATGFLLGVASFLFSMRDHESGMTVGPRHIIAIFAAGAIGGLVLASSGRLPGTK